MENVVMGEDIKISLMAIKKASGVICVEIGMNSCQTNSVFDLLAVANAIKRHPCDTIARVVGVASIIAITGADTIEFEEKGLVHIAPLTMTFFGNINNQRSAMETLQKVTDVVSKALTRWPEVKQIFDVGEERFLTANDAKILGIVN